MSFILFELNQSLTHGTFPDTRVNVQNILVVLRLTSQSYTKFTYCPAREKTNMGGYSIIRYSTVDFTCCCSFLSKSILYSHVNCIFYKAFYFTGLFCKKIIGSVSPRLGLTSVTLDIKPSCSLFYQFCGCTW